MECAKWLISAIAALGLAGAAAAEDSLPDGPDFKDVLSLEFAGSPRIAPDGSAVVYSVFSADWENNRYERELWMARDGETFQLTRTEDGNSTSAAWSPDGKWIAFLADRGNDTQIHVIRSNGGEARALTAVEDGVSDFEWSPDGKQMAVAITDARDKQREKIEKTYGKFAIEDDEFRMTHLWVLDVSTAMETESGAELPDDPEDDEDEGESAADDDDAEDEDDDEDKPEAFRRLTEGEFTISSYRWSPDGTRIAFDHRPDTRVQSFSKSDVSLVDVASGELKPLVEQTGWDGAPLWSPDGKWVLIGTQNGTELYYTNRELARVPAAGGKLEVLTKGFDEDPNPDIWLEDGIRFSAWDRTFMRHYRLDPAGGSPEPVFETPRYIWSVDYSLDGKHLAVHAEGPDTLDEIYLGKPGSAKLDKLTRMTEATADWPVGNREVVEWKSKDGATIEGVLLKPADFDPTKKHPLLVIIHGGPTSISYPALAYTYVYPVQQWLAKGAVILMPNYRGSAGYGEAFRSLNVRNLGVGDAWDVLSGVDQLIKDGIVDPERMGAMGWSQGGYISAFLTTNTDRFKAISVGAGISNWMTYYVNTDIHPFTRIYLEGTPWDDPKIYAKTSPMTNINQAKTPTLIQHGEFDRRVPTPNAYELFQGLEDVGVETELIIYKGFGVGITKPKERLAAVWHNWRWFARYVWGEEVEIPAE